MRKKEQKLILQMGMFYLVVILLFGLIIISEKKKEVIIPKVEKKLLNYINNNYKNIDIKTNKIKFNKEKEIYTIKVIDKRNDDLYFNVTYNYKSKKINSTYKEDYLEGKTLFKNIEKNLNKQINTKIKENPTTFKKISITYNTKLNNCTDTIKNQLLNKNYKLPLYTINLEDNISILTEELLSKKLTLIKDYFNKINYKPKDYNVTLNNKTTPTKSINIIIPYDTLNKNPEEIANAIILNDTNKLKIYNINYKYLN